MFAIPFRLLAAEDYGGALDLSNGTLLRELARLRDLLGHMDLPED